jgi:hypothetical protein
MLDLFPPIISTEDNLSLCFIPSEYEVIQALSSLGSSKALGPDGFTALFYKKSSLLLVKMSWPVLVIFSITSTFLKNKTIPL